MWRYVKIVAQSASFYRIGEFKNPRSETRDFYPKTDSKKKGRTTDANTKLMAILLSRQLDKVYPSGEKRQGITG